MHPIAHNKPYRVVDSFENDARNRCLDIVLRADQGFGFQEWRREPEDPGNWSLMCDSGDLSFASASEAVDAACSRVVWFARVHRPLP